MSRVITKAPTDCSPEELAAFATLARESGEVTGDGLEGRIAGAHRLTFYYDSKTAVGIAGIKKPLASYREKVARKSSVSLAAAEWRYELGWVFVTPWARKAGIGKALLKAALEGIPDGIFATSRTDNAGMHATFRHFGFVPAGLAYPSTDRPETNLQVFLRSKLSP